MWKLMKGNKFTIQLNGWHIGKAPLFSEFYDAAEVTWEKLLVHCSNKWSLKTCR